MDLIQQLFRTVEVTQAHYAEMQSVKLDVLGLPAETLPPHPDNHDASNEDDPEIESLFPSTLRFDRSGERVEPFTFAAFYSSRI
jgi:hypothetical protein